MRIALVSFVVAIAGILAACSSSTSSAGTPDLDGGVDSAIEPGDARDAAPPDLGPLPCDVAKIFADQCQQCHSDPPEQGAPMALVTMADLHSPAVTEPKKMVYELVGDRVVATGGSQMPPLPTPALPKASITVLTSWIAAGAPAGTVANCGN